MGMVLRDIIEARWPDMAKRSHDSYDTIFASLRQGKFKDVDQWEFWEKGQIRIVTLDMEDTGLPYNVVFEFFAGKSSPKMASKDLAMPLTQSAPEIERSSEDLGNGMSLVNASAPTGMWRALNITIKMDSDQPPSDDAIADLARNPIIRKVLVHELAHEFQNHTDGSRFFERLISLLFPQIAGAVMLALTNDLWLAVGAGWLTHVVREKFPRIATKWHNKQTEMEAVIAEVTVEELALVRDALSGKIDPKEAAAKLESEGFFDGDYLSNVLEERIKSVPSSARAKLLKTRRPELQRRVARMQKEIGKALR